MKNEIKQKEQGLWSSFLPLLSNEESRWMRPFQESSGLSVSEDEHKIYIEAALPGISPEEIEVNCEKGMLFIKAEKKEEKQDKTKKFYRRADRRFFYNLSLPESCDETKQPEATCKNGILHVSFSKSHGGHKKKKIIVKNG